MSGGAADDRELEPKGPEMMFGSGVLADEGEWGHMGGWGGAWMWFWGVVMMVLVVLIIVWIARSVASPDQPHASPPPDPNDRGRRILAERYARGELSTEEYRERLDEFR